MSEQQPPPGKRERRFRRRRHDKADTKARNSRSSPAALNQERLIGEALADLRDMDVREVMSPRVDVVPLTIPVSAEDVARAVRESGHSCFPVVNDDLDDLVGVLFVNDLFRTGRGSTPEQLLELRPLDISRRFRPPFVIPETLGILEALAAMREHRRAFAVVVDEYGGVAGVLTVKDLLEPLVGELQDEFDYDHEPDIIRVDTNRWLIDGQTSVDAVRERLGIDLPDGEYVTLGGYLFDDFGHIPEEGERVSLGNWNLKVVEMDKRRVAKVLARDDRAPRSDGAPPAAEVDASRAHATGPATRERGTDRELPEPVTPGGDSGRANGTQQPDRNPSGVAAPSGVRGPRG